MTRPPARIGYFEWRDALRLLAASCLLTTPGCGFQPTYARSTHPTAPAGDQLAAIDVAIIPERSGQLLRQALQARLQRFGPDTSPRYSMRTSFQISSDPIAITQSSTVTRVRLTGFAQYTVVTLGTEARTVTSGAARAVDGYDIINEQFFAADLNSESVQRRLAESIADQIALQLGAFFARPPNAAS